MQNKLFLKAADICELLEVKQTSAYEIIGNLNKELEDQGYLTLRGKVPTKVDLLYMAKLTGKTEEKITEELVGVIFKNPLTDQWETGSTRD